MAARSRLRALAPKLMLGNIAAFLAIFGLFAADQVRAGAWVLSLSPRLYLVPSQIDLGNLDSDETVKGAFTVRNRGLRPLKLNRVQSTCKCTLPEEFDLVVPPFQSRDIHYTFSAAGKRGETRAKIYIACNDPRTPLAGVVLRAFVKTGYYCDPSSVRFGTTAREERKSVRFNLLPPVASDAVPTRIRTSSPFLEAQIISGPKRAEGPWLLSVSYLGNGVPGYYRESAVVGMTGGVPDIEVPVEITISSDIDITPESFFYGIVEAGRSYTKTIKVRAKGTETLDIISVSTNVPDVFRVRREPLADGVEQIIGTLVVPPVPPDDSIHVAVNRISEGVQRTIHIPVTFVLRSAHKEAHSPE